MYVYKYIRYFIYNFVNVVCAYTVRHIICTVIVRTYWITEPYNIVGVVFKG